MYLFYLRKRPSFLSACVLVPTIATVALSSAVVSTSMLSVAHSQEKLSKSLLLEISREQSAVLCESTVFTQCMAFTQEQCLALSEKALQECLMPLPDTIKLSDLQNDSIEICPKKVYDDAGFSDEKAQQCLQEALK